MRQQQEQQVEPTLVDGVLTIHSAITRGLAVSLEYSQKFLNDPAGPCDARRGFADYVMSLSSVLHGHHLAEDEVVFPYLKPLLTDMPFSKLSEDHRALEPLIQGFGAAGDRLKAGDGGALSEMTEALGSVNDRWHPHIAIEEENITLENLAGSMKPEDHAVLLQRVGEHNQKNTGPDYLVLPFLLFNMEPEYRAIFTAEIPQVLTEQMIPVVWKEQWAPMRPFLLD